MHSPALTLNLLVTFALSPLFERFRPRADAGRTADQPIPLPVY